MLYNPGTIKHNFRSNTISAKEKRLIFGVKEKVGNFAGGIERATRPLRGFTRLVMTPITAPAKVVIGINKKIYKALVPPVAGGIMVVLGSATEFGKGAWEAFGASTINLGIKAPYEDIRANIWDLPRYIFRKTAELPSDIWDTRKRITQSLNEFIKEAPENVTRLVANIRQNTTDIINNTAEIKPIDTIKSIRQLMKDFWVDGIKAPIKTTINPIYAPFKPFLESPMGSAQILTKSKTQYVQETIRSAGYVRSGVRRMIQSPGHSMNVQSLAELRGDKFKKQETGKVVSLSEARERHKSEVEVAKAAKEGIKKEVNEASVKETSAAA